MVVLYETQFESYFDVENRNQYKKDTVLNCSHSIEKKAIFQNIRTIVMQKIQNGIHVTITMFRLLSGKYFFQDFDIGILYQITKIFPSRLFNIISCYCARMESLCSKIQVSLFAI